MAQAMDLGTHRLVGEPVTDRRARRHGHDGLCVVFSLPHRRSRLRAAAGARWRTAVVHSHGSRVVPGRGAGAYLDFALAPDEGRLAVSRVDPQPNTADVWTVTWEALTSGAA